MNIFYSLKDNIDYMNNKFVDFGDLVQRTIILNKSGTVVIHIMYIDMLVNRDLLEQTIISSFMKKAKESENENIFEIFKKNSITSADISEEIDLENLIVPIMSGDTVIFLEGYNKAILVSSKGFPNRGIPTADTEIVIQGSKEAFSEVFRFNTMLIRRRIRDTNLKLIQMKVGKRSSTDIGIMYMDDIVKKSVLESVLKRIKDIDVDAIMDTGYIEQFVEDTWYSPFPQTQLTERPDKASSALLEGRVVIIVDNSPNVLIVPATLNVFFQSSEDYYQRFNIMSLVRILRYVAGFLAISLPGLYLAIALYHPSMISLDLILKMSNARATVPLPGLLEVLLMEIAFELLREGGIRMPAPIGSTIGIVGGIIIGQAAVEAGLVSPIVVIVVALTAVATFAIPNNSLVSGIRMSKYFITIFSALFGLFGFCIAHILIMVHLASLKSFNVPYLFPFVSGEINDYTDYQDTFIRMPIFRMKKRPFFANSKEKKRSK